MLEALLVVMATAGPPCDEASREVEVARGVRVIAAREDSGSALDRLRGACFLPGPLHPLPLQEDRQ